MIARGTQSTWKSYYKEHDLNSTCKCTWYDRAFGTHRKSSKSNRYCVVLDKFLHFLLCFTWLLERDSAYRCCTTPTLHVLPCGAGIVSCIRHCWPCFDALCDLGLLTYVCFIPASSCFAHFIYCVWHLIQVSLYHRFTFFLVMFFHFVFVCLSLCYCSCCFWSGHLGRERTQHEDHEAPLHQMTASAIGNMPEVKMDHTKEVIMAKAMSLDQRNFTFKVSYALRTFTRC